MKYKIVDEKYHFISAFDTDNSGTTKIQKARELGIEIIDENEFIRRFMSEDN